MGNGQVYSVFNDPTISPAELFNTPEFRELVRMDTERKLNGTYAGVPGMRMEKLYGLLRSRDLRDWHKLLRELNGLTGLFSHESRAKLSTTEEVGYNVSLTPRSRMVT